MAKVVYPNVSLEPWMKKGMSNDFELCLFEDNITVDEDTVLGDLVEATFTGYARKTLAIADFTFTLDLLLPNVLTAIANMQTFTKTAGATVTMHGLYYLDAADGDLMAVLHFDAPIAMDTNPFDLEVIPVLGAFSRYITSPT